MRYLLLLLLPSIAFAQPTHTLEQDQRLAAEFGVSVLEVRLGKIAQNINMIHDFQKAEKTRKVTSGGDILFDLTDAQLQKVREKRQERIKWIKALCAQLPDELHSPQADAQPKKNVPMVPEGMQTPIPQ